MQKFTHSLSFNTLLWWLFLFTNDIFTAYHMINMAALSLPLCTTLKTWYVSQMSRVHVYALKIFFVCRLYSLAFMNTQMPANSKHIFLLVNGKSKNIVRAIFMDFLLLCSSWLFHYFYQFCCTALVQQRLKSKFQYFSQSNTLEIAVFGYLN